MKLMTIWTMRAMPLRERLRRTWDEWFLLSVAYWLPRRVMFWTVARAAYEYSRNHPKAELPARRLTGRGPGPGRPSGWPARWASLSR